MLEHLSGKGIEARTYYPIPLHLQECYKSLKYRKGDMPESERAVEQVFSIPVYPELTGEQKAYVADAIRSFFK
jgi:dTDP-4-amino-4,6-dideoxygalactose transaminase